MTRNALLKALLVLFGFATLSACSLGGNAGERRTEQRSIPGVTAVDLETSGDLVITSGSEPRLRITAGENVIDHLTSAVDDGRLVLGAEPGTRRLGSVRYELVLPRLESMHVNGSGDVEAIAVTGDALELSVQGSGSIDVADAETDELEVQLSGSGDVTVEGRATRQAVTLDGSGEYHARDLVSEHVTVTISGSGDADVHVTGTLDAVVSGSGSIHHTGGSKVTSRVDGSGEISGD